MISLRFDKNKKEKKIKLKVIATGVVAITLIGIVGISIGRYGGNNPIGDKFVLDIIEPIGKNLNRGFTFLRDNFKDIINYKSNSKKLESLQDENEKLKEEIIALNNQLDDVQSLDSLKKALNYIDEKYQAKSISASVVGKNDGNWYDSFIIGAGKNQGVKEESIVTNGNGLVGIVYEVSDNYSKAISLLDTKSSVSFKLLKDSNFKGVITQNSTLDDKENYKNKGYLCGYMFDSSYNVLPGDVITTSGLGLYPEGIPIGEVDKVIDDKNKSMKYVVVKSYVNFKNIDDVIIIEPRNIG
ncbi:rod shape-determining protein MreC [Romboutsia timonensis]|uniref:rod shape-determining protein MreC n=1 Tax=Romboutsia timonensis TaxID=1776391 RepID=UPI002A754AEC|nr:rod shape-determining protein MreC [Romboutsia timonensis]MDY3002602.1 rod shape-determining protein MreC [Romboutsia timonensis]MDY3959093.1 rod shape-determining protein MreC [Romboutsia timonensis]